MKKLLTILILSMFLLTTVSALEIDNVKRLPDLNLDSSFTIGDKQIEYKELWEKYPNVEIKNTFLKLFPTGTAFKGSLIEHTEKCQDKCYSELSIEHYDGALIQDIRFIGDQPSSYKIYYSNSTKEVLVDDYEKVCADLTSENGTKYTDCHKVKSGSHYETENIWNEYTLGSEMPKGDYNIKIEGKLGLFESTDWQIKVQGIWIDDWAIWDDGVVAYYNLDGTSGAVLDSTDNNIDGTNMNGTTRGVTGKINNAFDFEVDNSEFIDLSNNALLDSDYMSISAWIKVESAPAGIDKTIVGRWQNTGSTEDKYILRIQGGTGYAQWIFNYDNGSQQTHTDNQNLTDGEWHHIVGTTNSTSSHLYVDGEARVNKSGGGTVKASPNYNTLIGSLFNYSYATFDGLIDEVGFWNRSLTQTEVTDLHGGGTGLAYQATGFVGITQNSPVDNYEVLYTDNQDVVLNCTFNSSSNTLLNATIYSNYSGTMNAVVAENYTTESLATLTKTYSLGNATNNFSWYCEGYNNESRKTTSAIRKILQTDIIFTQCNSTYGDDFLNFTFKDEADLSSINASIPTSTFEYYLGDGTVTKELNFINNSDNDHYGFCSNVGNRTIYVDPYVQYKQGSSYPQRIYDPDVLSLTNDTTNKVLYLLSSADGIYVTFQVISVANTPLSGVEVSASREVDSETVIIGTGTTDSAGSTTFWVNPDFSHTFTFTKSGLSTVTYSVVPTQSSYTITMGGNQSAYVYVDNFEGLKWYTFPAAGIINDTTSRNYGFNISSQDSELVNCKIELLNEFKNVTLASNTAGAIGSGSSCIVQVSYSANSTYPKMKGRLSIDLGSGYEILEDDAYWIYKEIDTTGMTFSDWFGSLNQFDLSYFNDDPDHRDYTYILIFFLIVTIIMAVLNYAGWDIQTSGGMIYIMGFFVWFASIPGFLTLYGLSPFGWVNQFFVAIIYSMFMIGFGARSMM